MPFELQRSRVAPVGTCVDAVQGGSRRSAGQTHRPMEAPLGHRQSPMTQSAPQPAPEELIAAYFMRRKGYPDISPREVARIDGLHCWYFIYTLPDGELELEVTWDEAEGWQTRVSVFNPSTEEPNPPAMQTDTSSDDAT